MYDAIYLTKNGQLLNTIFTKKIDDELLINTLKNSFGSI